MKKITITLLLFTLSVSLFAQQATVNYTGPEPVQASKNLSLFKPGIINNNAQLGARTSPDTVSHWFNYPSALNIEIGGLSGYIAPMFSDSSVYFSYGSSSYGKAFAYGVSQEFNAYSSFFALANGYNLPNTEGYTLDSVGAVASYARFYSDTSVVDTLIYNIFQAAPKSNGFPYAYFTSTPDTYWVNHFNADTVFFPIMYYSPQTWGPAAWYYTNAKVGVTVTTIRVPLHTPDTAAAKSAFIVPIPNGGLQVKAGNLVGLTIAFKPGFTYAAGDTIDKMGNSFRYLAYDENSSLGEPLYTPGDNDYSFLVPQDVQYNQSIKEWDSLYIPTIAFLPGFQLQDNDFWYHVIYDTVSAVHNVNSVIASQIIYPNPASDITMLKYNLKTSANVIVNIYDITGKLIRSKNEGNVSAGLNEQLINTMDLSDGVYMVSVEANGIKSVSKLIVAR